jgi:cyclophilin family peptidyl-prolyl cis-trans isomerase
MGKENGFYPPKGINFELHSVGTASGRSQDGWTDDKLVCDMSEITTISRAMDLNLRSDEPNRQYSYLFCRRSLFRVFLATSLISITCLLVVVIARHRVVPNGPTRGADSGTVASDNSKAGEGRIVEFMVANLNTNANNCTQVGYDLQCLPYHNNATNKFRILLHPEWAPLGVDRFEYLTASKFWNEVRVFRMVPNFVSQFGISSYPDVQRGWSDMGPLLDDPVVASNSRGTVTFATSGQNTRTTQIFINMDDNRYLDGEKTEASYHASSCFPPGSNILCVYHIGQFVAPIYR